MAPPTWNISRRKGDTLETMISPFETFRHSERSSPVTSQRVPTTSNALFNSSSVLHLRWDVLVFVDVNFLGARKLSDLDEDGFSGGDRA